MINTPASLPREETRGEVVLSLSSRHAAFSPKLKGEAIGLLFSYFLLCTGGHVYKILPNLEKIACEMASFLREAAPVQDGD